MSTDLTAAIKTISELTYVATTLVADNQRILILTFLSSTFPITL
jgi:hypothetical protein